VMDQQGWPRASKRKRQKQNRIGYWGNAGIMGFGGLPPQERPRFQHWVANLNRERAFGARLAFTSPVELKWPNQAQLMPSFAWLGPSCLGSSRSFRLFQRIFVAGFMGLMSDGIDLASQVQPS
jgi:hypothetical protein